MSRTTLAIVRHDGGVLPLHPGWMRPARRVPTLDPVVIAALSPQQEACLRLKAAGCDAADIGRRLGIAEGTVKKHLQGAYRAMGLDAATDKAGPACYLLGRHDERRERS